MTNEMFKKEAFKKSVKDNVKFLYRKTIEEATQEQIFQAVSYSVKDVIIDNWLATQKAYDEQDPKIVYYMSMEFLMGRALGNNLINLCAYGEVKEALEELGFDLNCIEDQEPDPALGNGGLGRLAACFLDSLATLNYAAYGCGIRYHYGMFKQKIQNGYQIEVPDNWLKNGYPFELRRPEYAKEVHFGGYVRVEYDPEKGGNKFIHEGYQAVKAIPYDMPITGYDNDVVNTLRIWDAEPIVDFELDSFDKGDYQKAVEQENLARNIVEVLYPNDNHYAGKELRLNKIDSLLGPGMNIHRNPLNGRNFEYISEDPILTGRICAAQVKAMAKSGIGSTIKHFCGNNQEVGRSTSDSVISERALREIYLKGFEIAVKEGGARSVMTTYGSVNGLWTAGSYDLCTTILRKEWGFQGIVMTDWWAKSNYEGHQAEVTAKAPMVAAQNDIYMVVSDAKSNPENDDVEEMLHAGKITVGELQRNAANILGFLLKSPSVLLLTDRICKEELEAMNTKEEDDVDAGSLVSIESDSVTQKIIIDGALLHPAKGKADVIAVTNEFMGDFTMKFTLKSDLGELAQLPVSVFLDNIHKMTVSVQGTNGKWVEESRILNMGFGHNHYIKFYYGADNLEIKEIVLTPNR